MSKTMTAHFKISTLLKSEYNKATYNSQCRFLPSVVSTSDLTFTAATCYLKSIKTIEKNTRHTALTIKKNYSLFSQDWSQAHEYFDLAQYDCLLDYYHS